MYDPKNFFSIVHVSKTIYVGMVAWSRMAARTGDPPPGQFPPMTLASDVIGCK